MINFKKAYSFKIISLITIGLFLLNSTAYGTDLLDRGNLRSHFLSDSPEGRERLNGGLAKVKDGDDAMLVDVDGFGGLFRIDTQSGRIYYGDRYKAIKFLIPVYAVRHAQSVAQTLQGTLYEKDADEIDKLTEIGFQQADALSPDLYAQLNRKGVFDQDVIVLTSQLVRSKQTADPFMRYTNDKIGHQLAVANLDLINEIDIGIPGYIPPDQLDPEMIRVRDEVRNFNAQAKLPKGESYIDLLRRARKFILYANKHYKGKILIIFTHSLFMNALRIVQGIGDWETEGGFIDWNKHKAENGELWTFEPTYELETESFFDASFETQKKIAGSLGFKVIDPETGQITYKDDFKPYDLSDIELVVVPHGLTDGDVEGVLQSSKDVSDPRFELNAEGREQVKQGAKVIWDRYSERIKAKQVIFYRSETKRTAQTAQAFIEYSNAFMPGAIQNVYASDAIKMNLGCWEGTTKAQINTVLTPDERSRAIKFIKKNALIGPKNGQTFIEYLSEVKDFLDSLKKKYQGKTIIVFGHGIFIKAVKVLLHTKDIIDEPYLDWDSAGRSSYQLGMPLVINDIPRKEESVKRGIIAWRKENTRSHSIEELAAYSANVRTEGLRIWRQLRGPLAGAMSPVDLYTVLLMDYVDRERFVSRNLQRIRIIPKGTAGSTFYSAAAYAGLIEPERVVNINRNDLEIVPTRFGLSDASLYKMGTGLEQGIGLALASKIKQIDYPVIVFLTDGGLQLGVDHQAKFAAHMALNNLTVVVDVNGLQNAYRVDDVDPTLALDENGYLSRLVTLWQAYGWDVVEIDGHDFEQIRSAYDKIGQGQKPLIILAKTSKGRGISNIEGELSYSHKFPSEEDYQRAQKFLEKTVNEYRVKGYNIKYPDWVPVERVAMDNQGFAFPPSDLVIDDFSSQFEKPLSDQGRLYLENHLRSWLKEFISLNHNQVFVINTDNPSPFDIKTPIRSPSNTSPFIFAGINERFALNLAGGMFLEGLAPIYIGPAAHMTVNAEDWKMLGIGKQNVLVVSRSSGSALSYWGPGHLIYEDIELFKNPWCQVLQPAHAQDLELILENYYRNYQTGKPTYLRMQEIYKFDLPSDLFDTEKKREKIFNDGFYVVDSYKGHTEPIILVTSGKTVREAIEAGYKLRNIDVSYRVINVINLSVINKEEFRSITKGASLIITAIDALPQSLSSIVYDAIPGQREKIHEFGVRDGGSFQPEKEIFSKNMIDSEGLFRTVMRKFYIQRYVSKRIDRLEDNEEKRLIRESWNSIFSEDDSTFLDNISIFATKIDVGTFRKLLDALIGLGIDVRNSWSANYHLTDIIGYLGEDLLGQDVRFLKSIFRNNTDFIDLTNSYITNSISIPKISDEDTLTDLRNKYFSLRMQQRELILSKNNYSDIAQEITSSINMFMKGLIERLIALTFEEVGMPKDSKAVAYFHEMKTFSSDLDFIYFGPNTYEVNKELTKKLFLLGIKRDYLAVDLINVAIAEGKGKQDFRVQFFGNIIPISVNGGDFNEFYQKNLLIQDRRSSISQKVTELNELLQKWEDLRQAGGRVSGLSIKTIYYESIIALIRVLAQIYQMDPGPYDEGFFRVFNKKLSEEDAIFLKKAYCLVLQVRNLSQLITQRRWQIDDVRVLEKIGLIMKLQGINDSIHELDGLLDRLRDIKEKYVTDDYMIPRHADDLVGATWNKTFQLYRQIIESRL